MLASITRTAQPAAQGLEQAPIDLKTNEYEKLKARIHELVVENEALKSANQALAQSNAKLAERHHQMQKLLDEELDKIQQDLTALEKTNSKLKMLAVASVVMAAAACTFAFAPALGGLLAFI